MTKEKDNILSKYNDLVYKLYKLKMTSPNNLEEIKKLEYKITTYASEFNLSNIEKIDATLFAVEKYYDEFKNEEENRTKKRRGLTIYKDLSYKLHKTKLDNPSDLPKIKKLEEKIKECKEKYQLTPIEQVDIKIEVLQKYEELLLKREENKQLDTYAFIRDELTMYEREKNQKSLAVARTMCDAGLESCLTSDFVERSGIKKLKKSVRLANKCYPNGVVRFDTSLVAQAEGLPQNTKEENKFKKNVIKQIRREQSRFNRVARLYLEAERTVMRADNYKEILSMINSEVNV